MPLFSQSKMDSESDFSSGVAVSVGPRFQEFELKLNQGATGRWNKGAQGVYLYVGEP